MDRPWLKHYPKGVPADIGALPFATLGDLLESAFQRYGQLPAFSNFGHTMTFDAMNRASAAFASFLRNELGLVPGDRIAIQLPNLLQTPVALFGALRAGLVVVNTNPLYTPREMEHQFRDSGAKAIVILANFAANLQQILGQTDIEAKRVIVTEIGDLLPVPKRPLVNFVVKRIKKMVPPYRIDGAVAFRDALARGARHPLPKAERKGEDIAFLQYTGGTTGVSKGAMLTHANVLANMKQIAFWMSPKLEQRKETIITALPLYHIFSLTVNCFAFMDYGAHNVLITNPREFPDFVKTLRKYKFTAFTGVNTLFNALCAREDFRSLDFSSLKISVAGAMALQRAVHDRWKDVTKTKVIEGYGLTETSPVLCCNPVDGTDRVGTIGIPLPSTEVKIVDDQGNDLPVGEAGELCARGPQVMKGYWKRDDETAKVMLPGGWFRTGDVAAMDTDGFFRIVDRKKDMIDVSGFKVYPNEVEDVSVQHPKVFEAAVIGVEDEKSGEVVKAFIVKKDESLTVDELMAHYRKNLVNYKVPKYIEFRKELPKSNVGKVIRRMLRDEPK
jgi:long-chain acyl-CoA synthetase